VRQNLAIGQRRLAIQDFLNLLPKRIRSGAYDAAFARHVWIILAILGRQQIVFGDWVRRSSLVEQWSTNIPYSPSRTPAVQIRPFIAAMTPQLRSSFRKLNHHRSRGNNRYSALECKYSVDRGPAPAKMATWTGGVRRNAHAL
jgi:hypothetical protein